jgi:hypothetical protein
MFAECKESEPPETPPHALWRIMYINGKRFEQPLSKIICITTIITEDDVQPPSLVHVYSCLAN